MEIQFILTACIVNFKVTSVQPLNQMIDQAVTKKVIDDTDEIRENIQNLFDSVARNNTENWEVYRKILKQEEAKEREVFDAMKKELRIGQTRNSDKKKNFYGKNDANKNMVATKRETSGNNPGKFIRKRPLPRPLMEPKTDGELTENIYFNCTDFSPNSSTTLGKPDVCGMSTNDFMDLCATVLNRTKFEDYSLLRDREPEECKPYEVIVLYRFYITLSLDVEARKCPTEPPLVVMSGHGNVSVFIMGYVEKKNITILDLIYFL